MTDRDALAISLFPAQWKRASSGSHASKKKQQLRKRALMVQKIRILQDAGHACGDCAEFHADGPCGSYCELDTDFHGYALTKSNNLCSRWRSA